MHATRTIRRFFILAAVLLAPTARAQGPDCSSAPAIGGTGVHALDLTGRLPAGQVGGGACPVDTGASFGDVFWQWTCTTAGDYRFEIDTPRATSLALYEGFGCGALVRANATGYVYSAFVSDRQPGDQILVHVSQHVNSPDAIGTLTVTDVSDACSSAADDAYEDNDRHGTAVPIGAGSYPGLFVWRGDEDYFQVQVPADEAIRIDWQGGSPTVALRMLEAACGQLQYATTGTWEWANTTGAPVDLILNFEMRQTGNDCSAYSFDVAIDPAPCSVGTDDGFEPNDTCAAPAQITSGSYTGLVTRDADPDHYSIVVAPGDRLDVVGDSNAIQVAMFDPSCMQLSEAPRLNDYTNFGASPETIVFRVRPAASSGGCATYGLAVSAAPDPCAGQPDDFLEENDTRRTAAHIGNGLYVNLWASLHDSDFYSTCVAPGSALEAEIGFPDNVIALDLVLSNAPGVQYEYSIDRVRATYTNRTGVTVEVGMHINVLPILSDCWWYDLDISGATRCPVGASPQPRLRHVPGQH